jgi:hypothetical protein
MNNGRKHHTREEKVAILASPHTLAIGPSGDQGIVA